MWVSLVSATDKDRIVQRQRLWCASSPPSTALGAEKSGDMSLNLAHYSFHLYSPQLENLATIESFTNFAVADAQYAKSFPLPPCPTSKLPDETPRNRKG